jgi:hypothetical protein
MIDLTPFARLVPRDHGLSVVVTRRDVVALDVADDHSRR